MVRAKCYFITGGVRSGKSGFAEKKTLQLAKDLQRQPYYIASGVAFDVEMAERISRHQVDRQKNHWITIEQQTDLLEMVSQIPLNAVVLWDCVTTWLTNEMYLKAEDDEKQWQRPEQFKIKVEEAKIALYQLSKIGIPVLIVSNEVLDELDYPFEEVAFYREQLGAFHQWIVANCDVAIELDYGLPHYWKGSELL